MSLGVVSFGEILLWLGASQHIPFPAPFGMPSVQCFVKWISTCGRLVCSVFNRIRNFGIGIICALGLGG